MTGLAIVRQASRQFRLLSSAVRNGLKTESLKELSYVINNRAIYTRKNKTRTYHYYSFQIFLLCVSYWFKSPSFSVKHPTRYVSSLPHS